MERTLYVHGLRSSVWQEEASKIWGEEREGGATSGGSSAVLDSSKTRS